MNWFQYSFRLTTMVVKCMYVINIYLRVSASLKLPCLSGDYKGK